MSQAQPATVPVVAVCPRCDLHRDDARVRACTDKDCPLAHRRDR